MSDLGFDWNKKFSWHIDPYLFLGILLLAGLGMVVLYSASGQDIGIVYKQAIRLFVGLVAMLVVAQVPSHWLRISSWWLYLLALLMLVSVLMFGDVGKGAQRWLQFGPIRFQPSELMKLAMPMAVAAWFASRHLPAKGFDALLALVMVGLPMWLIVRQPVVNRQTTRSWYRAFSRYVGSCSNFLRGHIMALANTVVGNGWRRHSTVMAFYA